MDNIQPTQTPQESLRITYQKRPGLLGITLINLVFNILTLSIYRFWGKTNVRKHIWSCIHINGEPLEYTGTGMELFKGFLVVFFIYLLPFIILSSVIRLAFGEGTAFFILNFVYALMAFLLLGFALYKARKYQLTRTLWRSIRGNLDGSAWSFSLLYFGASIAKTLSLGWAVPAMNTSLQNKMINNMRFGDAAFKFQGSSRSLYPTFALCWILAFACIVASIALTFGLYGYLYLWLGEISERKTEVIAGFIILGILFLGFVSSILIPVLWAIYTAKELRTFADFTRFDGAQFKLRATTWGLIWLAISTTLITVFTLGIAWPFVVQRGFKYVIDRISLEGFVDLERIQQSQSSVPTRGEGLADAFDIGAF